MTELLGANLRDRREVRRLWDETHVAAALQGIVNRDAPRLLLRYNAAPDDFWFGRMTGPGGWLHGRIIEQTDGLEDLLNRFRNSVRGLVVYDERVPATSNLASTIAGVEGLLPVRHDDSPGSLHSLLTGPRFGLKAQVSLLGPDGGPLFTGKGTIPGTSLPSTGSAKNDCYRWLIAHYVRTGRVNPRTMGYYLDAFWLRCGYAGRPQNHTLTNHDYIIANQGILFDLDVWEDETPVDDTRQAPGTDLETLQLLLSAANDQLANKEMIHMAGFVPWRYKYTDVSEADWDAGGQHGAVATEWKNVEVASAWNAYLDADALDYSSLVNASFYRHLPLPDRIPQNPRVTEEELRERGVLDEEGNVVPRPYYCHYVGDYDAAAWLYWNAEEYFTDETRGTVPLNWAFNPNLAQRFPLGMLWTREQRTANDYFVAGDSGAGYVNPHLLSEPRPYSGLPSGMPVWEKHCRRFFEQWDLDVVGFVIDGFSPNMQREGWEAYARFSPGGIVLMHSDSPRGVFKGMPYLRIEGDLPREEAKRAVEVMRRKFTEGRLGFHCFRSVLMPTRWYKEIEEELDRQGRKGAMVLDMRTLLWLTKREYERGRSQHPASAPAPKE